MNASVAIQVLPSVQDEEEVIRIVDTYVKISYKAEGDVLTIDKKVTKHHQ